jgi:protein TonB
MIRLRNYRPPKPKENIPPPPPKKQVEKKKKKIKPIPDPTPDEPEVEPEPELEPEPIYDDIPDDVDIVFGEPEPPPALGPLVITGDIKPPQPIKSTMVKPKYTDTARLLRIQGKVIVNFVVTKDGFPTDIYVAKGLGEKTGLDQAAVDAIKKWVFKPALQNGKPVSVYYSWTLTFNLQ